MSEIEVTYILLYTFLWVITAFNLVLVKTYFQEKSLSQIAWQVMPPISQNKRKHPTKCADRIFANTFNEFNKFFSLLCVSRNFNI